MWTDLDLAKSVFLINELKKLLSIVIFFVVLIMIIGFEITYVLLPLSVRLTSLISPSKEFIDFLSQSAFIRIPYYR